jgi:hypothetical protein
MRKTGWGGKEEVDGKKKKRRMVRDAGDVGGSTDLGCGDRPMGRGN